MIQQFVEILKSIGLDPRPEEVADILWLAGFLDEASNRSIDARDRKSRARSQRFQKPIEGRKTEQKKIDLQKDEIVTEEKQTGSSYKADRGRGELYLPRRDGKAISSGTGGLPFRSPTASALPGILAIGRSLRPLMRKVSSRTRFVLDVETTVQQIADQDNWIPALKPAPSRWFDVNLVVDGSPSMVIWKNMITEWRQLLERHGAFRNITTWKMSCQDKVNLYRTNDLAFSRTRAHNPRELIDPTGQRLFLIVSDCIAQAWYNGEVAKILATWGLHGPVAIVNVLPQHLWNRSALGRIVALQLSSRIAGCPNKFLNVELPWDRFGEALPVGFPVPVVTLEPMPLSAWAGMVAGKNDSWNPGFLFPFDTIESLRLDSEMTQFQDFDQIPPDERVRRFRSTASPTAWRLACYLAAAPLSLPVIRLIQRVMLPESKQIHLAEFFLSGLIRQISLYTLVSEHPDEIEYDFVDGVREILLGHVYVSETIDVLSSVSDFVNRNSGQAFDFRALIAAPDYDSLDRINIDEGSRPFAAVTTQVLLRLGGTYAKLAKLLDEGTSTRITKSNDRDDSKDLPKIKQRVSLKIRSSDSIKADMELDYRILIVGNFSGNYTENTSLLLKDREIYEVKNRHDIADVLAAINPKLDFSVPNRLDNEENTYLSIKLDFKNIKDFNPDEIVDKVEPVRKVLEKRERLRDLKLMFLVKPDLKKNLDGLFREGESSINLLISTLKGKEQKSADSQENSNAIIPIESPHKNSAIDQIIAVLETDVQRLAIQEFIDLIPKESEIPPINKDFFDSFISQIDKVLSAQMDEIIHHDSFRALEATWRGLKFLFSHIDFRTYPIKISILDATKQEIFNDFEQAANGDGYAKESVLFHHIYWNAYDRIGTHPYTAMILDYSFDNTANNIKLLKYLSVLGETAQLPVVGNVDVSFFGRAKWGEVMRDRGLANTLKDNPEYFAWWAFRDDERAKYIGLALPRFLGRLSYGPETDPTKQFNYIEKIYADNSDYSLWINSSFALAVNFVRCFAEWGWSVKMVGRDSGGKVENLPTSTIEGNNGQQVRKAPIEIVLATNQEMELSSLGFIPFVYWKDTDYGCFFELPSVQKPAIIKADQETTAINAVASRLQFTLFTTRLVHYLNYWLLSSVGRNVGAGEIRHELSSWLNNLVADFPNPDEKIIARHPLRSYAIGVTEIDLGFFEITLEFRPHIAIPGMDLNLRTQFTYGNIKNKIES